MERIIFLDVETNGIGTFRPPTQKIIQLSWIVQHKEYDYYINDIDEISPQVPHKITTEYCQEKGVSWEHAYSRFHHCLKFCEGIVCHNADFDVSSIAFELKRRKSMFYPEFKKIVSKLVEQKKLICTMQLGKDICRIPFQNNVNNFKFPKLEELYEHFYNKKPTGVLHNSIVDCRVLMECFKKMNDT